MARTHFGGNLIVGKWFCRFGWWLFPYSTDTASQLSRATRELKRREKLVPRQPIDGSNSEAVRREIQQLDGKLPQDKVAFYNAQPQWSFKNVEAKSLSEALKLVDEFFCFVKSAAAEFCWTMNPPSKGMHWRHSWKHTTLYEIDRILSNVSIGQAAPPQLTLELLGPFETAQQVFRDAEGGDPEAVARIDSLFPSHEHKLTAVRHLFDLKEEAAAPVIPTSAELASRLAEEAVRSPDSQQASEARRLGRSLFSERAARGSRGKVGRTPSPHHAETVKAVWMICYSMARQIKEIDRFLRKFEPSDGKRRAQLTRLYSSPPPLIPLEGFMSVRDVKGACDLAGKLLHLSASKIEKIVYPTRAIS